MLEGELFRKWPDRLSAESSEFEVEMSSHGLHTISIISDTLSGQLHQWSYSSGESEELLEAIHMLGELSKWALITAQRVLGCAKEPVILSQAISEALDELKKIHHCVQDLPE